jgi:hypothetical protein
MKRDAARFLLTCIASLALLAFRPGPALGPEIPDEVNQILKHSCFDCHSNSAKKKVPKAALNFDKWDSYRTTKKISKLDGICKTVENNKMPPEKYVKSDPGKALSADQKRVLCEWAKKESEALMEGIDE